MNELLFEEFLFEDEYEPIHRAGFDSKEIAKTHGYKYSGWGVYKGKKGESLKWNPTKKEFEDITGNEQAHISHVNRNVQKHLSYRDKETSMDKDELASHAAEAAKHEEPKFPEHLKKKSITVMASHEVRELGHHYKQRKDWLQKYNRVIPDADTKYQETGNTIDKLRDLHTEKVKKEGEHDVTAWKKDMPVLPKHLKGKSHPKDFNNQDIEDYLDHQARFHQWLMKHNQPDQAKSLDNHIEQVEKYLKKRKGEDVED